MTVKHRQANTNLLESIGLELLKADPSERLAEENLKIEHIPAELIRPDSIQPRRVLPEQIHFAFHANRLTPSQALRELIQVAQVTARQHGRPFASVLDLVPAEDVEDSDQAESLVLSPDEHLIRDLVNLAITIRDDGQVNPLTLVDITQGVTRLYRIETGERRYWATWLLRDFLPNYAGDGTMPCIIIPAGRVSVFRQAKENTARAGLSAIAMARQAALLILTAHGIERPDGAVSNDFYRQALDLSLRDKREYTADILAAMGGITRSYFSRIKGLMGLSDDALEMADRHNLDEARLRYVLNLHGEDQAEMVRQIIKLRLTRNQVKDLCEEQPSSRDKDSLDKPPRQALQFARLIRSGGTLSAQAIARVLLEQDTNAQVVQARIQAVRQMLDEVEQHLIKR